MKEKQIENDFAKFYLQDDIMYFIYKPNVTLDLDAAKQVVNDRLTLQESRSYPVICNITGLKSANKEARDFLAKEGSRQVKAVGLVADKPALKIMTDFYLMVNKPDIPTKVFRETEDALVFLSSYK